MYFGESAPDPALFLARRALQLSPRDVREQREPLTWCDERAAHGTHRPAGGQALARKPFGHRRRS
ncbi:hypothetical protein ACFT2C_22245 [Promicromonospora sp. NPDC057138]|uniref:hypothetical protein n=1 Tax=Promicromonospora sp. NPDC057138 TaxID=3346031 RepID=UPI0036268E45